MNNLKIYLVAGELSGDTHGAGLIRELLSRSESFDIRYMGGNLMEKEGGVLAFHYSEFAIMGFVEVLKNIRKISAYLKEVENDIKSFQPDHVIFIDFPGFNLRLAKRLSFLNLHYYIAPKAWAWNKKRVHTLAKYFSTVNCILPFEVEFFSKYGVPAKYVGNPSVNQVDTFLSKNRSQKGNYIALFPGSRKQEVERVLPIMLESIGAFPGIEFRISKASSLRFEVYEPFIQDKSQLFEDNYKLLQDAKAALVTSGTATLETALFNVPQVVCYIANPISYFIAKRLVKLKYISLVNLIADESIVTELIQNECTENSITEHLNYIISDEGQKQITTGYETVRTKLSTGDSGKNAIDNILSISS